MRGSSSLHRLFLQKVSLGYLYGSVFVTEVSFLAVALIPHSFSKQTHALSAMDKSD